MSISKYKYDLKFECVGAISTFFMKIKCFLYGISIGRGCKFFGSTNIYRQKGSVIMLGNELVFRSWPNSNLIGINRRCSISTLRQGGAVVIGDGCGFSGTVIGAFVKIELGRNVRCGANTLITDSDWHDDDPRSGGSKPVYIGDNVWLGEGVKVLKGVTIGNNSLIGAGSIVVSDIPANVVAAGNPCKVIKELSPDVISKMI